MRGRDRAQQVLRGVLLHVVVATLPVEQQPRRAEPGSAVEIVPQPGVKALHVDHGKVGKRAVVGGLAATLGIKDRVVENRVGSAVLLPDVDNLDIDLAKVRISLEGVGRLHGTGFCHDPLSWTLGRSPRTKKGERARTRSPVVVAGCVQLPVSASREERVQCSRVSKREVTTRRLCRTPANPLSSIRSAFSNVRRVL